MSATQDRLDQTAHELFIAECFVDYLARADGTAVTGLRAGEPDAGEPDCVCVIDEVQHGIEVVDCWKSGADAKITWELARDAQHRNIRRMVASSSGITQLDDLGHPSGDQLAAIAEQRMRETLKAYGMLSWLILNASQTIAPLHDIRHGPWLVQQIRKPAGYRFKDVYLCLAGGQWGRIFFRIP